MGQFTNFYKPNLKRRKEFKDKFVIYIFLVRKKEGEIHPSTVIK